MAVSHFLHRHFLCLLLGAYGAAAVGPAFGLWLRGVTFADVSLFGESTVVTLPMLLLALLLLNAGLAVRPSQLRELGHSPLLLAAGLVTNVLVPLAFTFAVAQALRPWGEPDEAQEILVGLGLVAAMPIAGSSTAWSQNSGGEPALSLGLVLASTFLSPLTTPVVLDAVGAMASGEYAEHLRGLAASGAGVFLTVCVAVPALLGVLVHGACGEQRLSPARPALKLVNSLALLLLIYANASVSLPEVVAYPDADFLALILGVVVSLCGLTFASGWVVGRLLKADRARQTALMFGLGMNNNGTGLVLAGVALAGHPRVMLPILLYNLVQHLVAGLVASLRGRRAAPATS
jgi:BASS family bile acid:Na+ symporter